MKKMLVGGLLFLSVVTAISYVAANSDTLNNQVASNSWILNVNHPAKQGQVLGAVHAATVISCDTTDTTSNCTTGGGGSVVTGTPVLSAIGLASQSVSHTGDTLIFTVTVKNTGNAQANSVSITPTSVSGMTLATQGSFMIGSIAPGTSATGSFTGTITATSGSPTIAFEIDSPGAASTTASAATFIDNSTATNCTYGINAASNNISSGQSAQISWTASQGCFTTYGSGQLTGGQFSQTNSNSSIFQASGSYTTLPLTQSTTYSLAFGSLAAKTVTVSVTSATVTNCTVTSLDASPSTLPSTGGTTVLTWVSSNCTSAVLSGGGFGSGISIPANGTYSLLVSSPATFRVTGTGANGSTSYKEAAVAVSTTPPAASCSISSFTVNGSSTAVTVNAGTAVSISYATSNCVTAKLSSTDNTLSLLTPSVSNYSFTPTGSVVYTLTASDQSGTVTTKAITITVNSVSPNSSCSILSFTATPSSISSSTQVMLAWTSTGCSTVSLSGSGFGSAVDVPVNGTYTLLVSASATYKITGTASNATTASKDVSVTLNSNQQSTCSITSFTVNGSSATVTITSGAGITVSYTTSGCGTVRLDSSDNTLSLVSPNISSYPFTPKGNVTYTLTASDLSGTATTKSINVNVTAATPNSTCKIVSFSASPNPTNLGQTSTLTWSTQGCGAVKLVATNSDKNVFTAALSSALNGSYTTPALNQAAYYRLAASPTTTASEVSTLSGDVSQDLVVSQWISTTCVINSFTLNGSSATTQNVDSTEAPELAWTTTGCSKVMIVAPPFSTQAVATSTSSDNFAPGMPTSYPVSYILTGYDSSGNLLATSTITAASKNATTACTVTLKAALTTVAAGGSTTLTWTASNCTGVTMSAADSTGVHTSSISASGGSMSTGPLQSTTSYSIQGTSSSGVSTPQTVTITVNPTNPNACSISSFSANPTSVVSGSSATLSWSTANCTTVTLSSGTSSAATAVQTSGSTSTGALSANTTYVLKASDTAGNAAQLSVTVAVTSTPNATAHVTGTNIISGSTVYYVDSNGEKRGYTSAGAFLSYPFNSFDKLVQANSADLALPNGPFVAPMNGSLVNDHGTIYVINGDQRQGFANKEAFLGLGYSFANIPQADTSFMQSMAPITSASVAHPRGALINVDNANYVVTCNGKTAIPNDTSVTDSWGITYVLYLSGNTFDQALAQAGTLKARQPSQLNMDDGFCSVN